MSLWQTESQNHQITYLKTAKKIKFIVLREIFTLSGLAWDFSDLSSERGKKPYGCISHLLEQELLIKPWEKKLEAMKRSRGAARIEKVKITEKSKIVFKN